jgi:hypothetical protein
MRYQRAVVGLMAASFCLGIVSTAQAQDYQQTTTTTTNTYAAPTVMNTSAMHSPVSGQVKNVTYGNDKGAMFWNKEVEKTITMEPGFNTYSLDRIHWGDRVSLTLVNPTDKPLQFETVQRWGKPYATVVPPHSSQYLSFIHSRPFTKEERFNVMAEPTTAISDNDTIRMQQAAAAVTPQPVASSTTTTTTTESTATTEPSTQTTQRSSAVRGFW